MNYPTPPPPSVSDTSSQSWMPEEVHTEVLGVQQVLKLRQTFFLTQQSWAEQLEGWSSRPLVSLDLSELQRELNGFLHTVDHLEKGTAAVGRCTFIP